MMQCPDDLAGTKASCPKCGQRVLIPTPPKPMPTPSNKTTLGKLEDGDTTTEDGMTAAPPRTPSHQMSTEPDKDAQSNSGTETRNPPALPEANRGIAIMVLGIVSCSCCLVALIGSLFSPVIGVVIAVVALPIGIIAWVMEHHTDRNGIREKRLTNEGYGFVLTGYICGIVGTSLASIIIVSCAIGTLFCFAILYRLTHPQPAGF